MQPKFFNYLPDPDIKFERDYSRGTVSVTFYVETKVDIQSDDVANEIQAAVAAGDNELAYGLIYGYDQREFDMPGYGHAMIQAAFGIIPKDQRAADALRRVPKGGTKP